MGSCAGCQLMLPRFDPGNHLPVAWNASPRVSLELVSTASSMSLSCLRVVAVLWTMCPVLCQSSRVTRRWLPACPVGALWPCRCTSWWRVPPGVHLWSCGSLGRLGNATRCREPRFGCQSRRGGGEGTVGRGRVCRFN